MASGKKIIKSIAAAGVMLGGIDIFQDCGAVYAAELEETEPDHANRILEKLEIAASASTSENVILSEAMDGSRASEMPGNPGSERAKETWTQSEDTENRTWMESETMTAEKQPEFASAAEEAAGSYVRSAEARHTAEWRPAYGKESQDRAEWRSTYSTESHYTEEWRPTHGYRGMGSWKLTRKAVENACVNEGLELTEEELDRGANIWFYSGVTLLYFNAQYGSGWDAFVNWFEQVSGERTPNFGEEELGDFHFSLSETATSESSTATDEETVNSSETGASESSAATDDEAMSGSEAESAEEITDEEEKPPLSVEAE